MRGRLARKPSGVPPGGHGLREHSAAARDVPLLAGETPAHHFAMTRLAIALALLFALGCAREQPPNPAPALAQIRTAIRQYHATHGRYPQRLQDLPLREIPPDPVTKKPDWRVIVE
ncbi:MAG: hypothetical protein JOZ54_08510, partial [Acidobacteria bacterium]|nr:hypothetical protein [Acidobacteriota bacterium]